MKAYGFLIFGVLLIGLAALWFLTPISQMVMPEAVQSPSPDAEFSTRSPGGTVKSVLNWAEIIVDGLNVGFGAVGLYFTIKGWRLRAANKEVNDQTA